MGIPFLGELPLNPAIRIGGDTGRPVALKGDDDPQAAPFSAMAIKLVDATASGARKGPRITIQD
jgi:ATP-binding protein involved in chromosome partitioning